MASSDPSLYVSRFRALIIGRANAGKTTILKSICASDQDPMVHNVEPSAERGEHDIRNELVFESNSGFVFHDSRGFESGQVDEIDMMKEFMAEKANTGSLEERLHAIWYCIPVDNDRLITSSELQFFDQCDPHGVPVILLFTKFESRDAKAFNELLREQIPRGEAATLAPGLAEKTFHEQEIQRFSHKYPPKEILFIRGHDNDDGSFSIASEQCTRIIESTTKSLNDITLRQLLISVQKVNIMLCVKYAIEFADGSIYRARSTRESMKELSNAPGTNTVKLWISIGCWFPHAIVKDTLKEEYNKPPETSDFIRFDYLYRHPDFFKKDYTTILLPKLRDERRLLPHLHAIFICACILIILERSSSLDKPDLITNLKLAALHLVEHGSIERMLADISTSFSETRSDDIFESEEEYLRYIAPKLYAIVERHLLPRDCRPKQRFVDKMYLKAPPSIAGLMSKYLY